MTRFSSPASPLEDGRTQIPERVFFHGTSRYAARRILVEGLRDWSWTDEGPYLRHLAKRGIARRMHGGMYGRGTYVSCDWRAALHFGPVLFRVGLMPGTRVVRLDEAPDLKVLDSLRREFGAGILTNPPRKEMPRNKRLTLDEAIQLARHHCREFENGGWASARGSRHEARMLELRSLLVRYGIHAWGEPSGLGGIVVFATDRLRVLEVVLSVPTEKLWWECRNLVACGGRFRSLDELLATCRASTNRTADVTLRWVDEANRVLAARRPESTA